PGSEGQVLSGDIRQLRIERDRQEKRCNKAIAEVDQIERRIEREAAAGHDTRAWAGRLETAARHRDEVQAKLNALNDRIEELEVGYSARRAVRRFR
ncbi:MAG: hypothetical protein HZB66_03150, partial [Candidatus Aenigmarchaeota archaeon]|nr:hypothetical protein [Candidatus Aenigmarchaeota archaeon]